MSIRRYPLKSNSLLIIVAYFNPADRGHISFVDTLPTSINIEPEP